MSQEDPLVKSKEPGGAHHLLSRMCGEWAGVTRTWFEPGVLADESPWRGVIRPVLDGRFAIYEYEGAVGGDPLRGMVMLGCELPSRTFQSAWIDSFHTGSAVIVGSGGALPDGFVTLSSYTDPGGGPRWGWRTEMRLNGDDELTVTAYNITPHGAEGKAVETVYTRQRAPTP